MAGKRKPKLRGPFSPNAKPMGPFAKPEKHPQKIVNPIGGFVRIHKKPKRLSA